MINNEIKAHSTQMFSSRFCLITKTEFRYYKSKEQFLTLQKPLCIIPYFQINEINLLKSKPNLKKIDLLHIRIVDNQNYQLPSSNRKESKLCFLIQKEIYVRLMSTIQTL
jgi:hypothetical protein